jgi:hypothetical protein
VEVAAVAAKEVASTRVEEVGSMMAVASKGEGYRSYGGGDRHQPPTSFLQYLRFAYCVPEITTET